MLKLWDLAFEIAGDDINLEQDMGCGDVARITLHRVHLRHLAEQAGLIPATSHADPDRTIARLSRHLRLLYDRVDELGDRLHAAARLGHQDLEHECALSLATWEMAHAFVQDLEDDPQLRGSASSPELTRGDAASGPLAGKPNAPKSGPVACGNPPKSGATSKRNDPENGGVQPDLLSHADGSGHGTPVADAMNGAHA